VRLVGVGALLCAHGVVDAARAAAVCNVTVVDDGVPHNDGVVDVCIVNNGSIDANDVGVIGKTAAAPLAAGKADTHVAEAVVDAAIIADVAAPVTGMENV